MTWVFDENASLHLGANLSVCSGSCDLAGEDFQEGNVMRGIQRIGLQQ